MPKSLDATLKLLMLRPVFFRIRNGLGSGSDRGTGAESTERGAEDEQWHATETTRPRRRARLSTARRQSVEVCEGAITRSSMSSAVRPLRIHCSRVQIYQMSRYCDQGLAARINKASLSARYLIGN